MARYESPVMAYVDFAVFLCTSMLIFQGAAVYHDDIRDELIAENNERGIYSKSFAL